MTPRALAARVRAAFDRLFDGCVEGWVYSVLRVGIAAIFLVRHSDWLRPLLFLEHHRFVDGLLFLGSSAEAPQLESPLALGIVLSPLVNDALVYLRTALALLLLFGVRIRLSAGALALVSYVLLAADRYRYYHHLYLLYVAVAYLALVPERSRFDREPQPLWPLQLIRALVISVYLAAGISKLDPQWLRGEALEHLARLHVLGGAVFERAQQLLGYGGIGILSCAIELVLPPLLLLERTRRLAIALAWAFHAAISLSMPVYSFGAQMAVLVIAFWPASRARAAP